MNRLLCLAVLLAPALVVANPIIVHNTGVGPTDVLVAPGAAASFWTLSARPAGATEPIGGNAFRFNCCYWADQSNAAWVSTLASGSSSAGGIYTYDLVIDLTGLNPATAVITGIYGSDNSGTVSLNGNAPVLSQGSNFGSYPGAANFTINSGFVAGLNTIHVGVNNEGNPTAFFVQFLSATANPASGVPEPTTILLTCSGLAGLLLVRRKRSKQV